MLQGSERAGTGNEARLENKDSWLSLEVDVAVVLVIWQKKYTCVYFKRRGE